MDIITQTDFEEKVMKSATPVLVDFYATWCGPCKMAEPILEELSKTYAGKVIFYKIDVDASQTLAGRFGVMSIPTTVLFFQGKELGRAVGFSGKEGFEQLLKKTSGEVN